MTSRLRRVFVLTAVVAGSALLALALLHSPPARARALDWAKRQALTRLGFALESDRLDYNLLALSFRLSHVRLSMVRGSESRLRPDTGTLPPFFEADEVALDLPWSLLGGSLAVESLQVVRPRIAIIRGADGAFNLPSRQVGGAPLDRLPIGRLSIRDGTVLYTDAPRSFSLAVSGLETALAPEQGTLVAGALSAGGLRLDWGSGRVMASRLGGRVTYDGSGLSIEPLRLRTPEGDLEASGRIDVFGAASQVDIAFRAVADVGRVVARWQAAGPLAGSLGVTGRVSGRLDHPALNVEFAGGLAGGTAIGTARLSSEGDHPDVVIAADYSDLDLRQVLRAGRVTLPVRVASRLAGRGELIWRGGERDGLHVALENNSRPTGVRDALDLSGRATLSVERGAFILTHTHALGEALDVSGVLRGRLDDDDLGRSSISGDASLRAHDLAAGIRRLGRAGLDLRPLVDAGLEGRADATVALSGSLDLPHASGGLRIEGLRLASAMPARVEARVDLDGDRLVLDGLELIERENVLRGRVSLEFAGQTLDGELRAGLRRAGDWLQFLPDRWRPEASIDVVGDLGGTLTAPQLNLAIGGQGIECAGQRFDRLAAKVRLAGSTVVVEDSTLSQDAGGAVRATGRYDFGRGRYDVKLTGSNVELRPVPVSASGVPLPLSARADVEWEGDGTLARPAGRGMVAFRGLAWDRWDIGTVRATGAIDGDLARVSVTAPELRLTATGSAAIAPPHRFTVTGRIADADLARWIGPALGSTREVQGAASLTLEASGDLDRVESAEAEVAIDDLAVAVGRSSVQLAAPARVRYAAGQLAASGVVFRSGDATLRVGGLLSARPEESTLDLAIEGDLGDVNPWLLELTGWSLGAHGALRARARVTGTARRPVIDGDLAVDGGTLAIRSLPALTDLRLRATLKDEVLQIGEMRGVWQGVTLTASGRVPAAIFDRWLPKTYLAALTAADRRAHITAAAAPITGQALAPWLPPETLAEIDGEAAATLTIDTDALDLKRIHSELTFDRLSLSVARVPFNQEAPTRLRLADGRVSVVDWRWGGPTNRLQITGGLTLEDVPRLDAEVRGMSDLRSISAFVPEVAAAGQAAFDVRLQGAARDPDLSGRIGITSGELRVRSPRIFVSSLTGTIDLAGRRLIIRELSGTANGGALQLEGELERQNLTLTAGSLTAMARGVALEWPQGLRTELMGDLRLTPADGVLRISGAVTVRRGAYREPLVLTRQALAALRTSQAGAEAGGQSWLDRVRLDVTLTSDEQVTVDNNYGQLELGADLHLLGSLASPALTGRLTVREGGKLFLGGNVFRVDRGTIDFVDPRAIKPELTFTARTRVSSYEIVLSASGPPDNLTVDLTSDDTRLTKGDLASLLLTGQRASESSYVTSQQVSTQVLTLLSGDLLGVMGQRVGLDALRVERGPSADLFGADLGLLSTETRDPGTRLSLTKRLGARVDFVLSQNLRENGGLTWIVVYRPGHDFEIRGVSRDDGSRSIEASQQLALGGGRTGAPPPAGPRERPRIGEIRITGAPAFPESELREHLRLAPGRSLDFYQWQEDRDALERFYRTHGRLEARISARRESTAAEGGTIILEYAIDAGPRTELEVDGFNLSAALRRELQDAWADSVYDGFLLEDVRAKTRAGLARANYLRAQVTAEMTVRREGADPVKTLHVSIAPGPPTSVRTIEFTGNAQIATSQLEALVRQRDLDPAAWLAPGGLESAIRTLYASEGFLDATATVGTPRFEGASAVLPVSITEGPSFSVGDVSVEGTRARAESEVRSAFGVLPGTPYRAARVEAGRQAVEAAYRREGYNGAQVGIVRSVNREGQRVDLRLVVGEGPQQVLAGIDITGASGTREGVVTQALNAKIGAPVNLEDWSRARTRLYETGVFRSADIRFEPVSAPAAAPQTTEPVRAKVALEEVQPYRFRYGVQLGDRYDSTGGLEARVTTYGILADLERRNLFGRALTTGLAGRYEKDLWDARTYLTAPRFFTLPYRSSVYLTRTHQLVPVSTSFSYVEDRWVATAEQEARWRRTLRLTWGYRYERAHVFEPGADPADPFALDITLNIARLTSALTADTRDDPFAPHRGWFSSATLEYSAPSLGSDLRFLKTLLQGYYFRAVGPAVLASAARLGTIGGSTAVVSTLFLAGGGTTVRGYRENSLGPQDVFGSKGGKALIILNQEVRIPIVWWIQGVGFVDAGNVFEHASDLSLSTLKVGVGGGLRLNTPFALLRVDFGVPLSRPTGSPFGRWYFSLGHVF